MTVERIIPCICTKHPPTAADSTKYGMPIIKVGLSTREYTAECPACGRGGILEYKSPYLAMKHWNEMQEKMYREDGREIVLYDDFEKYTNKYGEYLPEYTDKWDVRTKSHCEASILKGCLRLMQQLMGRFGEHLDFIGVDPESEAKNGGTFVENIHEIDTCRHISFYEASGVLDEFIDGVLEGETKYE